MRDEAGTVEYHYVLIDYYAGSPAARCARATTCAAWSG